MKSTTTSTIPIGWLKHRALRAALMLAAGLASVSAVDLSLTNNVGLPFLTTPWSRTLTYPKFNPAFGTLQRADLIVRANVRSSIRAENLTDEAGTMFAGSTANIFVIGSVQPAPLVSVQAQAGLTNVVTAFDGVVDFGGPTGNAGSGFSAPGVNSFTIVTAGFPAGDINLPQFIGPGAGTLAVNSTGATFAQGPGDIFTQILTSSGADVKIVYTYTPFFASVGDRVWVDTNRDGVQDPGEAGIPGVTVTLYDAAGVPVPGVLPQITGPDGEYLFTSIYINPLDVSQNYKIGVSQPAGLVQTYDLDDGATTTPGTGLLASFSLGYIEDKRDVDFGFAQPVQSLGDRVWHDINANGAQDSGEVGIQNATVTLYAASDVGFTSPLATRTTDSDGKYLFTDLAVGDYTVVVSGVPSTFRQTYDLDDGFKLTGFTTPNQATSVSLGVDQMRLDVDFGYQQIDASVGDYVWFDLNRNGVQDSGETPISGVAVQLRDTAGAVLKTTTTDSTGLYLFTELPQGSYLVTVTAPAGYEQTYDLDDGTTPLGGFNSPDSAAFSLATGEAKRDVDFGYVGGQIGDRVWNDLNGDGVQNSNEPGIGGVVVTLTTGTGTLTTTTDGNGFYTFGNQQLPAGSYTVSVAPPPGYRQTFDLDDGAKLSGFTSPNTATAALNPGQSRDDVDFGYQQLASLGDRVWLDYNGNGVQEGGETGISGRTVVLFQIINGSPVQIATDTTDNDGFYGFSGLPPGDYRVTVQNPPVKHITTWDFDDQGGAPVTQHTALVSLAVGQNRSDVDFGYQPLGSLGDTVWLDVNKNGVQDGGAEVGISGATVTVTSTTVGTFTTATDSNGYYFVDNLPAAIYTVTVQLPVGLNVDQTYDLDDGFKLAGFTSPNQATGVLTPGQSRLDFDFGYAPKAAAINSVVGDLVWYDLNGNGTQDGPGETGIPGVQLFLFQPGNPSPVAFTLTDGNGFYQFPGLAAGAYTVVVNSGSLPAGLEQTYDLDGILTADQASSSVGESSSNLTYDFGYRPLLGSIGDRVWLDADGEGDQDPAGEPGLANVEVNLLLNGVVVSTKFTDGNGNYTFGGLQAGNYTVSVNPATLPAGLVQTFDFDGTATANTSPSPLNPAENRVDQDFGYRMPPPLLGSIGDRVWLDVDGEGDQDPAGEPGLANVEVNLLLNGVVVSTKFTDGNGNYSFVSLPAGNYTVVVNPASLPAGLAQTFDIDGTGTPNSSESPLAAGQDRVDQDFGYRIPPVIVNSLGDYVWFDRNRNGLQDADESGFKGVTVELLEGAVGNTVLDTEVTGANGGYLFDNLADGIYRVRFVAPANFDFTIKDAVANSIDGGDSDADVLTGVTLPVSLAGGQDIRTVDAGVVNNLLDICVEEASYTTSTTGGAPLCGVIRSPGYWRNWKNHYNTSQFQAIIANTASYSTLSIAQVTAVLKNTANQYARHLMAAQLTAAARPSLANGIYQGSPYIGLTVLQILVTAANTPASSAPQVLRDTVLYLGGGGETGGGCGNPTGPCLVTTHGTAVTVGHALYLPGIGSDFIFDPTSGKFFENPDGTATLTGFVRSASNPGRGFAISVMAGGYSATVPVSPAGSPKLELDAANYVANGGPVDPATWSYYTSFTGTLTGFGDFQGAVLNIVPTGPSLQIGVGANGKNLNFGFSSWFIWSVAAQPSAGGALPVNGQGDFNVDLKDCALNNTAGSIGDRVWLDANSNGAQDGGEAGFTGIVVQLRNSAGLLLAQTVTDGNGNYLFTGLPAANYQVMVFPPANYGQTYDLDGVGTPNVAVVALANGQNRTDADFGYVFCPPVGSIGDRVWNDANNNGVQDGTGPEPGLVGVTVQLLQGSSVVATATTGANGIYTFNNLLQGSYTVNVLPPSGYTQTFDLDGVGSANQATVSLGAGQGRSDVDFGYRQPPAGCVVQTGCINRELWQCVGGTSVTDIPLHTAPSISDTIGSLETPENIGDNYGQRIRGYLVAPATGSYVFWIASDDSSQLWLSTDSSPASKVKIGEVAGWTGFREWTKYPSQKSVAINLTAGQPYYIEVLQKEGNGGDHVSVGWARPGQNQACPSEIIPASVLAPITAQLCNGSTPPVAVTIKVEAGAGTYNGCLFSNSQASGGAAMGSLASVGKFVQVPVTAPTAGTYQYVVRYSNGNVNTAVRSIFVNGVKVGTMSFPPTGSWSPYVNSPALAINLNAGVNQVKIIRETSSQPGDIDIDFFTFTK